MTSKRLLMMSLTALLLLISAGVVFFYQGLSVEQSVDLGFATSTAEVQDHFYYPFNNSGVLNEIGQMGNSMDPYFWLNSGAQLWITDNIGETIQGELTDNSPWRSIYRDSNPTDTDNGYHPQNIFRFVTRSKWQNMRQECHFLITKDNLSLSTNRNASNGLLLFNRYQDSNNLYYAGIRVDGAAVIKKKTNGTYYTLAYNKIFPGSAYDRNANPDILPKHSWLGLRSEITNQADGTTAIRLYVDQTGSGSWILAAAASDDGRSYGGPALVAEGYAGIRTDFMDVQFDDYRLDALEPRLKYASPMNAWASYADYQNRNLTVTWTILNEGDSDAIGAQIIDAFNSNGVMLVNVLPVGIGNVGVGASTSIKVKYFIPQGVTVWKAGLSLVS